MTKCGPGSMEHPMSAPGREGDIGVASKHPIDLTQTET